jgi:hypothetical protein
MDPLKKRHRRGARGEEEAIDEPECSSRHTPLMIRRPLINLSSMAWLG